MHWIYLIHEFHNLSWITEINELFHDILIYWDAPVSIMCIYRGALYFSYYKTALHVTAIIFHSWNHPIIKQHNRLSHFTMADSPVDNCFKCWKASWPSSASVHWIIQLSEAEREREMVSRSCRTPLRTTSTGARRNLCLHDTGSRVTL